MRIAFAGTPEFAAYALRALIDAGHEAVLVFTPPDRSAGRGMRLIASPVKQYAVEHGIPVYQPTSFREPESSAPLAAARVDVLVVAAYGLILPPAVLTLPKFGCLNIHASLLPRWRGAAPIQRAILAGDAATGVCIMQMEAGLDTGPVLLSEAIPITPTDTGGTLHDKLMRLGAALIVDALARLPASKLFPTKQPAEGITYAEKLRKEEGEIDWSQPAVTLERKVRAFNPFPVAHTRLGGDLLRIWQAHAVNDAVSRQSVAQIVQADAKGVVVACGTGALVITELQKAGGRRLDAAAFLAGNKSMLGAILD